MLIGPFLRRTRETAGLTQRTVAQRSGVPQGTISAYERGLRSPRLDQVERLLAAMRLQLALRAEPRDADLDAAIDAAAGRTMAQRCAENAVQDFLALLRQLDGAEPVIEGALAAVLLGAPVPLLRLDLAILDDDAMVAAFTGWASRYARRWVTATDRYGLVDPDPQDGGSLDYECVFGRLRLRLAQVPPEHVELRADDQQLRVCTLPGILVDDSESARLLDRMRARLASAA